MIEITFLLMSLLYELDSKNMIHAEKNMFHAENVFF